MFGKTKECIHCDSGNPGHKVESSELCQPAEAVTGLENSPPLIPLRAAEIIFFQEKVQKVASR